MEDFETLRAQPQFVCIMHDLDVSYDDQLFLFETLDADGSGTIELAELVLGLQKLRGEARRSDIVSLTIMIESMRRDIQGHIKASNDAFQAQSLVLQDLAMSMS